MSASVSTWFYMNGSQRVGPVSQDQLCDMFRKGLLNLQTLVWSDAFRNWTEASKIPGLRSLAPLPIESTIPAPGRQGVMPAMNYETPVAIAGPVGIGGWLILPTLGLIFMPIAQALVVLGAFTLASQPQTTPTAAAAWQKVGIVNAIFGAYVLFTAIMFFQKKRIAPMLMMLMYAGAIVFSLMSDALARPILATMPTPDVASPIIRPIAVALVWIPYFNLSRRVKNTFVN